MIELRFFPQVTGVPRKKSRNPASRRAELKRLMLAHETVSVEKLCELLDASPATIRRDLAALEAEGTLERTRGGAAVQVLRFADQNFAKRELEDVDEKRRLAEAAISSAEFTSLTDDYNFELNREGKNGGEFEGGWNDAKYDAFAKWIAANPAKLKMPQSEFDALLTAAKDKAAHRSPALLQPN